MGGPSGPERLDFLIAQMTAMLILYQGRPLTGETPTVTGLTGLFLSELPWTPKPPPKVQLKKKK